MKSVVFWITSFMKKEWFLFVMIFTISVIFFVFDYFSMGVRHV